LISIFREILKLHLADQLMCSLNFVIFILLKRLKIELKRTRNHVI